MSVTISVAISSDGYMDDSSGERLRISCDQDFARVYELRAEHDAIVIGGETLRRDNPRLGLKSDKLRALRRARAEASEPCRVIISGSGAIDPSLRIFQEPQLSPVLIFSTIERPELEGVAEVIVVERICAAVVVSQLERRGLYKIFVEGGAQIIEMFFSEGMVDSLRLAKNPSIVVADPQAPRFRSWQYIESLEPQVTMVGTTMVSLYRLRDEVCCQSDRRHLERAIEVSRRCTPSPTSYCVGAVVVTLSGEIFEGYTHETSPTHHAEQAAISKALAAGASLRGASIYSSMEPCSTRSSEPESCSQIIIRHGFSRAIFALYEPSCFVCCRGALNMRLRGIEVLCIADMGAAVIQINSHLLTP